MRDFFFLSYFPFFFLFFSFVVVVVVEDDLNFDRASAGQVVKRAYMIIIYIKKTVFRRASSCFFQLAVEVHFVLLMLGFLL